MGIQMFYSNMHFYFMYVPARYNILTQECIPLSPAAASECATQRTNPFAAKRDDKMAMRSIAKLLCTLVVRLRHVTSTVASVDSAFYPPYNSIWRQKFRGRHAPWRAVGL